MRVGLVGCSKQKLDHPAPARELYSSTHFRKTLAFAERFCDRVFIVSTVYGLVDLDTVIAPYDHSLSTSALAKVPVRVGRESRLAWGARTASQIRARAPEGLLVFVCGRSYVDGITRAIGARPWVAPFWHDKLLVRSSIINRLLADDAGAQEAEQRLSAIRRGPGVFP